MFFLVVVVLGIVSIFSLPLELSPNVENPKLTVTISWFGSSPEAVEAYVTSPIEAELATVIGIKRISSVSSRGLSKINLDFHSNTDINFARVEINEKLSSLKNVLPIDITPPQISNYVPLDFQNLQGFLTYSISANRTANEIRKYLIDNVLYKLKNIDGVSNVEINGGSERLIEIIVDYNKVKLFNISEDEINSSISDIEKILSAGVIEKNTDRILLKINNQIKIKDDISNQIIKPIPNGNAIRLKDIGNIIDDFEEEKIFYRINGKETVTLTIDKEPGANTLETAKIVQQKIFQLSKEFPKDYNLIKELDRSEDILKDLKELFEDSLFSLALILIITLTILKNLRFTLIIFTSIIFSLLFSFSLFYLFNLTLNILTISCFVIGFGFIVDNSIVVVDYLDKNSIKQNEKYQTVLLRNIFYPLLTSTITITSVFLSLIFLTGELKLYFKQFALGIAFTLTASLIVAFSIVPILYAKSSKNKLTKPKKVTLSKYLYRIYDKIAENILKWKKISIGIVILIIGLPVWLLPNRIEKGPLSEVYNIIFDSEIYSEIKPYINYALGGALNLFFNHINRGEIWSYGSETYIYVRLELPNGNRIERINQLCKNLENEILVYKKNFKNLIANVVDEETAILRIEFTPQQANSAFPYLLKNFITAYAINLGGVDSYIYGFGPGFSNAGGFSSSMFNVEIKGFNYESVRKLAEDFRSKIIKNPRVDNVDIDKTAFYWNKDNYEIIGKVNREKLFEHDMSINELLSIIAKNSGGNVSYNKFRIENDAVNYKIKFSNYNEMQLSELEKLIIYDKQKRNIKIGDLVSFEEKKTLSKINRVDQQYVRNVSFEFKGPYKFGNSFLEASIKSFLVPEGYSIKTRDTFLLFENEEKEIEIWKILGVAIIIIFMLLTAFFESYRKSLIIITAIPFAFVGTIFIYWLTDSTIDRGAYAGMLLLVGLSVSNSITLVDYISKNIKEKNKIIELTKNRLRAIFLTSLTTFGALLPFIFNGRDTFWKNLSLSILGGIVTSTISVIFIVPLLYKIYLKANYNNSKINS